MFSARESPDAVVEGILKNIEGKRGSGKEKQEEEKVLEKEHQREEAWRVDSWWQSLRFHFIIDKALYVGQNLKEKYNIEVLRYKCKLEQKDIN